MTKFRFHRGSLDDSLKTTETVNSLTELYKLINEKGGYLDPILPLDKITFTPVGALSASGGAQGRWETHLVSVNRDAMGYSDGVIVDAPVEPEKLKEPLFELSEFQKTIARTVVVGGPGSELTIQYDATDNVIAIGKGVGPYFFEYFPLAFINKMAVFSAAKAEQDVLERIEIEKNQAAKKAAQEAARLAGKKVFVRPD